MGKNTKLHNKKKIITVVETPDGQIPRSELELTQCRNERGGSPTMFWIVKDNWEKRYQKVKGDETIIEKKK